MTATPNIPFFETMCCFNGAVLNLPLHQARLRKTALAHHLPIHHLETLLPDLPHTGLFKVRVRYGSSYDVSITPYTPKPIQVLQCVYHDTIEYRYKSSNRHAIDSLFLKRDGADDILIIKQGLISDTSIANIAFYDETSSRWVTPKTPLLEGTKRAELLASNQLHRLDITPNELVRYKRFALMNAMIGFQIVENGIIRP